MSIVCLSPLTRIARSPVLLVPLVSALVLLPVACGGGDDSPSGDSTADAAVDVQSDTNIPDAGSDTNIPDTGADVNTDAPEDTGTDTDAQVAPFTVVSTEPTDQSKGFPLDKTIRISFSAPVADAVPLTAFTIEDAAGKTPNGKWETFGTGATFKPAMLHTKEVYTVKISTLVGDGTSYLDKDYTFSFTTGELTLSGERPPTAEDSPIGAGFQTPMKRPEYAIVWSTEKNLNTPNSTYPGVRDFVLVDHPTSGSAPEIADDATALTQGTDKVPVAGQFDDDGWDETAVVQLNGGHVGLTIMDTTAVNTVSAKKLNLKIDPNVSGDPMKYIAATAADFDHDGRDELLIAMIGKTGTRGVYWRVVDYNETTKAYEVAVSEKLDIIKNPITLTQVYQLQVTSGDLDADGLPEAALLWSGLSPVDMENNLSAAVMLDDLKHGMKPVGAPRVLPKVHVDLKRRCPQPTVALTAADIDGDGADELLFGGTSSYWVQDNVWGTSKQCKFIDRLYFMDNSIPGKGLVEKIKGGTTTETSDLPLTWLWTSWMSADSFMWRPMPWLVAGRFTGDPVREEVMFHNKIYMFHKQTSVTARALNVEKDWPFVVPDSVVTTSAKAPEYVMRDGITDFYTRDVKVADMDQDGKDDVVMLRKESGQSKTGKLPLGFSITYFDLNVPSGGGSTPSLDTHKETLAQGANYQTFSGSPRLALPNIDDDSAILELVEHEAIMGDDTLVAVLGVPPWKDGIGQNVKACSTDFGTGQGASFSHSVSASQSLAATLGLTWAPSVTVSAVVVGIKITLAKVQADAAAGVKFGYSHAFGTSLKETISYKTGHTDNLVIVDNYVYESYKYKIVYHPDASKIGKFISVNVPLGRRRSALSQTYYNAHNGNAMDIDASVLGSVPGQFTSYPNLAGAQTILAQDGHETLIDPSTASYLLEPPASNGAAVKWGYSITHSDSNSYSVGLFVSTSVKACTPNAAGWTPTVCLGLKGTTTVGYAYKNTFSSTLSFGGSVGSIPSDKWFDNVYHTGMFAYRVTKEADPNAKPVGPGLPTPGKQQFIVVGYYIQ